MHRLQHPCQFWNPAWKPFSVSKSRTFCDSLRISTTLLKMSNSSGVKSNEQGGCRNNTLLFLAIHSRMIRARWQGALSWNFQYLSFLRSGRKERDVYKWTSELVRGRRNIYYICNEECRTKNMLVIFI